MPQLALALRVLDASVLWDDLRRSAGVLKSDPWASAELTAQRPLEGAAAGGEGGWEYLLDGVEVCNIHGFVSRAGRLSLLDSCQRRSPFTALQPQRLTHGMGPVLIGLLCACRACLMIQRSLCRSELWRLAGVEQGLSISPCSRRSQQEPGSRVTQSAHRWHLRQQ